MRQARLAAAAAALDASAGSFVSAAAARVQPAASSSKAGGSSWLPGELAGLSRPPGQGSSQTALYVERGEGRLARELPFELLEQPGGARSAASKPGGQAAFHTQWRDTHAQAHTKLGGVKLFVFIAAPSWLERPKAGSRHKPSGPEPLAKG